MSMSRFSNWAGYEPMEEAGLRPAASSVQFDGLSSGFDDLPQLAVGPVVPDAAITVGPFLLKHAETNKLAELLGSVAWEDDFFRRLRLKEPGLVLAHDPQSQRQAASAPEEQLANFLHGHRRVPLTSHFLLSRI